MPGEFSVYSTRTNGVLAKKTALVINYPYVTHWKQTTIIALAKISQIIVGKHRHTPRAMLGSKPFLLLSIVLERSEKQKNMTRAPKMYHFLNRNGKDPCILGFIESLRKELSKINKEMSPDEDEIMYEMMEIENDNNGRQHCKIRIKEVIDRSKNYYAKQLNMTDDEYNQWVNLWICSFSIIFCVGVVVLVAGVP